MDTPTVLSSAAIVIAALNFLYTQRKTDSREYTKWRRDQLTIVVTDLSAKIISIKTGMEQSNMSRDELNTVLRSTTDDVYRIQLVSSDWFAGIVVELIEETSKIIDIRSNSIERTTRINKVQSRFTLTARREIGKQRTGFVYRLAVAKKKSEWQREQQQALNTQNPPDAIPGGSAE